MFFAVFRNISALKLDYISYVSKVVRPVSAARLCNIIFINIYYS